jgi:hypothetical protein
LLEESEELYNKMIEDLTTKTINDVASDNESSLSLLLQNQKSDIQRDSTQRLAVNTYMKKEQYTFIQSEVDNEDEDIQQ